MQSSSDVLGPELGAEVGTPATLLCSFRFPSVTATCLFFSPVALDQSVPDCLCSCVECRVCTVFILNYELSYSLRFILLLVNTDISTTKICLDISVLAKSIRASTMLL
jgi:hypothetical protein